MLKQPNGKSFCLLMNKIYNPDFVRELFDSMSKSYERMNYITSFGFSERWRRSCVQQANLKPGDHVADLMTGMGECWTTIIPQIGSTGQLTALDFSKEMLLDANRRKQKYANHKIEILLQDVFNNTLQENSMDCVISGFGIKTFSREQLTDLAKEVLRVLKPGGRFSFIDVSVPKSWVLRSLYMFYLKKVIPVLGKLFLGNPENYKMLGVYTENFQNAEQCAMIFRSQGLITTYRTHFFGCASGITGHKPEGR